MNEFEYVPKLLKPRDPIGYTQIIPKIIWQTMQTNRVSAFMKSYTDTWIDLNPEYEYRFHDENDRTNFLKTEFPDYLNSYNKLKSGSSKADLWRYLIIYKYGGIYADIDCKCNSPLRKWVNPEATFVTQLGINKDICQWLIISIPENPIFIKAAEKTLHQSLLNSKKISYYGFDYIDNKLVMRTSDPINVYHDVLSVSGPPVLQYAAEECFKGGLIKSIFDHTQLVCVSAGISCQMNGNVKHDTGDPEFKKSYKKLKIKHYNRRIERLRRKIATFFTSFNARSK